MTYVISPSQTTAEIHVGDSGTSFISTIYNQDGTVLDLSPATSLAFRFESPSHVITDKTASVYMGGTTGKMIYILEDGFFDVSGVWKYQAIITFSGGTWYTNRVDFWVLPSILAPA